MAEVWCRWETPCSGRLAIEADMITHERLLQIDYQVPNLLRRHKLMRNFFLSGNGLFLAGLAISAHEMFVSHDVVQFEALRMLQAGIGDTEVALSRAARASQETLRE